MSFMPTVGMRRRFASVAIAAAIFTIAGCGGSTYAPSPVPTVPGTLPIATATPTLVPPDTVVGVTWACEFGAFGSSSPPEKEQGSTCEQEFDAAYQTQIQAEFTPSAGRIKYYIRKVVVTVNVRTAQGTTYTAYLDDPQYDIQLGDPWPRQ